MSRGDKVGLVLAGGGARGAYEAGALSVLLPALEARGQSPQVIVGTSVGAISAAYLAGSAHLTAVERGDGALDRWRRVGRHSVMRSLTGRVPVTVLQYAGELLSLPGVRVQSLTDTAPLSATLDDWISWDRVHANVEAGHLESATVVATAARDGRSVAFIDTNGDTPPGDDKLQFVTTSLTREHVRASAAIPILFPPVRVESPEAAAGWYFDGGTRLDTPIKPALDQGVTHVVVIALDSVEPPAAPASDDAPPDFGDAALHLLQGALVDPLIEDARTLATINTLVDDGDSRYRTIPYMFIAPGHRGMIGELAAEVFEAHYGGLNALRSLDLTAFNQILGGSGPSQGALISLLFFEQPFIERLIDLGQRDAQRWLDEAAGPEAPWHEGRLEDRPGSRHSRERAR